MFTTGRLVHVRLTFSEGATAVVSQTHLRLCRRRRSSNGVITFMKEFNHKKKQSKMKAAMI